MKTSVYTALVVAALAVAASLAVSASQVPAGADQPTGDALVPVPLPFPASAFPWPSQFAQQGVAFTIYPPQLDRWQDDRLQARAVVSVQAQGARQPVFGVLSLSGHTEVNAVSGAVTIHDVTVEQANFPSAADLGASYVDMLRQHLSKLTWTVARDRLESDLAIEHASREVENQPLHDGPPRILYSDAPAVLVSIDGAPEWREMVGLGLSRMINTRALVLRDSLSERYFIFVAGRWMEARSIEGPWSLAQVRPAALEEAKQQAVTDGLVDLLEGAASNKRAPAIFVSTVPSELVQTDGPPLYSPIQGTPLLYVTNSPNRVFLDLNTQLYYVLLAGRWYSSGRLNATAWSYVPGSSLPASFAAIPDRHAMASVLEAVPGTAPAQEAVIANSVPQVATIKRAQAKIEITYDGQPQFTPIEGTTLQYAVNSPLPVIRVSEDSFYSLDNGVWFVASAPFGPRTVASSVPPVIYTIPRSSPLHYVTYVRVYDATPEVVQEGYTPGYAGSYVAPDNTVVYGTGWNYQPWIGSVWYEPPVTWGFGFSAVNTWWNPWWPGSPWWGPGWAGGFPCFQPWWGPWIGPAFPVVVVGPGFNAHHSGQNFHHHANRADVAHVFHRWGAGVAMPFSPHDGPVRSARLAVVSSPVVHGTASLPMQSAAQALHPSGAVLSPQRSDPARPQQSRNSSGAGAGGPVVANRPAAGFDNSPSNVQVFRHMDGHWQRFAGNGQWQEVNAPPTNTPEWMSKSYIVIQGSGTAHAAGVAGARPNISSGLTVPGSIERRPLTASQGMSAALPQRSGPAEAGRFSTPVPAFIPRSSDSGQVWGGAASSFGRGGGGWGNYSSHAMGGSHLGGGHAMGGGHSMGGGSSHR